MFRLLAVDDEPINLELLRSTLESIDCTVDLVGDGRLVLDKLRAENYDLILLDRMMPAVDGLTLLRQIKQYDQWRRIPVIMQTAATRPDQVKEGLEAGAYYYLTKPFEPALRILVRTVLEDVAERRRLLESCRCEEMLRTTLSLVTVGEFRFRTLDQARALATGLAMLCPDPQRAMLGLSELLVNAIEHGNLGIGYQTKNMLVREGRWVQEIERRYRLPELRDRHAQISLERGGGAIRFVIRDEGEGFDWMPYQMLDPERAFDLHGRGIAMARMFGFDQLEYLGTGNTVTASFAVAEPGKVNRGGDESP
jgi:CheY-like chemotaxis protein